MQQSRTVIADVVTKYQGLSLPYHYCLVVSSKYITSVVTKSNCITIILWCHDSFATYFYFFLQASNSSSLSIHHGIYVQFSQNLQTNDWKLLLVEAEGSLSIFLPIVWVIHRRQICAANRSCRSHRLASGLQKGYGNNFTLFVLLAPQPCWGNHLRTIDVAVNSGHFRTAHSAKPTDRTAQVLLGQNVEHRDYIDFHESHSTPRYNAFHHGPPHGLEGDAYCLSQWVSIIIWPSYQHTRRHRFKLLLLHLGVR